MTSVTLDRMSVVPGELIRVEITNTATDRYSQVQVEVLITAVANRASQLGFGTEPQRPATGVAVVSLDTRPLRPGVYEIGLVRLHTPVSPGGAQQVDLISRLSFAPAFFEVRGESATARSVEELHAYVETAEADLQRAFVAPVDVRPQGSDAGQAFRCLVFVRNLLVGVGMRFGRFELLPTNTGLDSEDAVRLVNRLLGRFGMLDEFEYNDAARSASRQGYPVCVVHFPHIVADSPEQCRDYCRSVTDRLILAMALVRDAAGIVFEVVVVPHETGAATKYAIIDSYVGNALTGNLAGENFGAVDAYLRGLDASEMNRFLVGLYHEARRERSRDFQYVRFWQILETMAEAKNYDPTSSVFDFAGNEVFDGDRRLLLNRATHCVFNLMRENELGTTESTWSDVHVWFALRNAVAHFGAVSKYQQLRSPADRERCRQAIATIRDIDPHLMALKEFTKLLLMRALVVVANSPVGDG